MALDFRSIFRLLTTYGPMIWAVVVYIEDRRRNLGPEDVADDTPKLERAMRLIARRLVARGVTLSSRLLEDISEVIGVMVEAAHDEGLFSHHDEPGVAEEGQPDLPALPKNASARDKSLEADLFLDEFLRRVPERSGGPR